MAQRFTSCATKTECERKFSPSDTSIKSKPPFNRKQWGGSIGGPLYLPRLVKEARATLEIIRPISSLLSSDRMRSPQSPLHPMPLLSLPSLKASGAQTGYGLPTPYKDWRRQRSHRSYIQLKEQPVR